MRISFSTPLWKLIVHVFLLEGAQSRVWRLPPRPAKQCKPKSKLANEHKLGIGIVFESVVVGNGAKSFIWDILSLCRLPEDGLDPIYIQTTQNDAMGTSG